MSTKTKTSVSRLKKIADKLCSEYVRRSNPPICYTCGKRFTSWKELQCGHFVSRYKGSTRYDLDNLRPQCVGCNYFGQQYHVFAGKLLEELGPSRFKKLIRKGNKVHPFTIRELEKKMEYFQQRLKNLNERNLNE